MWSPDPECGSGPDSRWRSSALFGFSFLLLLIPLLLLRSYPTSGPVSTGMGDRVWVRSRCGTFISICDKPLRSTQPDHPFVSRRNEYQPKGGDALRLGSRPKGSRFVCGWHVKLCDPLVTQGPYERLGGKARYKFICLLILLYFITTGVKTFVF